MRVHSFTYPVWTPAVLLSQMGIATAWLSRHQVSTSNIRPKTSGLRSSPEGHIPILLENERLLIVNKPLGIPHHDDSDDAVSKGCTKGMVSRVREQTGQRVWGVHRLDRVTSGILVMAKDAEMAGALSNAFAQGQIQKVYMGISAKRPTKKKQGWIQGGMVRSRDKSWKLTRASSNSIENFAKTRFFSSNVQSCHQTKMTLLLFRPITGKTHQLRVAAKSMGLPLFGDPIYKDGSRSDDNKDSESSHPLANRTYLHASGIWIPPLLDNPVPVVVWNSPPFEDILGHGDCQEMIGNIMEKHCDIPELLELAKRPPTT